MTAGVAVVVWLLGLAVGSFLNVVVYRLPRGLSIGEPVWSFCPHCKRTLAWFDNLPVLGWLLVRGRCRYCHAPVSVQYPLVEAATGLVFVVVHHLIFVDKARYGLSDPQLPLDWPVLAAWLVLAAALIACAAMDIVSYMIDTSVTNWAAGLGLALLVIWPNAQLHQAEAASAWGAGALAACAVALGALWWTVWRQREKPADEQAGAEPAGEADADSAGSAATAPAGGAWSVAGVLLFVAIAGLLLAATAGLVPAKYASGLVPSGLLALLVVMAVSGGQPRQADAELHEAIEAEAPQARRLILSELAWLSPSILAGALVAWLVFQSVAAEAWRGAVAWKLPGGLMPLTGAAYAALSLVVAAGAGWAIRIVFTLILGREAFGLGDIYILAAIGAAAGWDIALLSFLLAVPIALAAWLLGLLAKRSAMIAFGPPLALGALAALWLSRPAATRAGEIAELLGAALRTQPQMLLLMGGVLLVGAAAAIVLSRMLRRWLEAQ